MDEELNAGAATRRAEMPLGSVLMELRDFRREVAPVEDGAQKPAARASIVFTTGARVLRYDWMAGRQYLEELVVSRDAVDLSRLERGAPLLDTHAGWSLRDTLGVVENPKIEGGRGTVEATFSRRPEVAGIVQDVEDGILRNVSVGYSRDKMERIPPQKDGDLWVYRVTRWTPHEVSIVPMPADMDAQIQRSAAGDLVIRDEKGERPVRTFPCEVVEPVNSTLPTAAARGNNAGDVKMDEEQKKAAAAAEAEAKRQADLAAEEATRIERARAADIMRRCQVARLGNDFAQKLIADGVKGDAIAARILDAVVERQEQTETRSQTRATITRDEVDTRRAAMSDAIMLRVKPNAQVSDAARQYRGDDLIHLARRSIIAAGGNADGMTKREIAVAAMNLDRDLQARAGMHSTSDFPQVLASTVNRSLRNWYDVQPQTFTGWARAATVPDFRQVARVQLSNLGDLQQVNEGGEYEFMSFGDSAEKYSLVKYGGIIAITWEALVNDDLGAFDRLPRMIASKIAMKRSDIVYGILSTNAALADTVALFHATHGNLPSAAAISDVSLGIARALMRKQKAASADTSPLNLEPRYLIVGPDKEVEAYKYTSTNYVAAKSSDINPAFNTSLQVVVDGRVSGNKWYLSASPDQVDTVEYASLEGEGDYYTERREGFEVDGLQVKVRMAFAAKAIDYRGLVYNSGA